MKLIVFFDMFPMKTNLIDFSRIISVIVVVFLTRVDVRGLSSSVEDYAGNNVDCVHYCNSLRIMPSDSANSNIIDCFRNCCKILANLKDETSMKESEVSYKNMCGSLTVIWELIYEIPIAWCEQFSVYIPPMRR